jgi:hypothetical protein
MGQPPGRATENFRSTLRSTHRTLTASPIAPDACPRGAMVFLQGGAGVPSVSRIVQVQ